MKLIAIYPVSYTHLDVYKRQLYKLKYVLDNEPLVKRYNKQYNLVNKMYKNITEELTNAVGIKKEIKCLLKDE